MNLLWVLAVNSRNISGLEPHSGANYISAGWDDADLLWLNLEFDLKVGSEDRLGSV
jgi:hypothetical protein